MCHFLTSKTHVHKTVCHSKTTVSHFYTTTTPVHADSVPLQDDSEPFFYNYDTGPLRHCASATGQRATSSPQTRCPVALAQYRLRVALLSYWHIS